VEGSAGYQTCSKNTMAIGRPSARESFADAHAGRPNRFLAPL